MLGGFVVFYNSKIEIKVFYRLTSGFFLFESKLGSLRESHSGLHCFWSRRCDWTRKLVPPSQPIRYQTKPSAACAPSFFPALQAVCLFHNEFSLDPCELFLRSYWLLWLLWWRFQKSQNSINSNTKLAKIGSLTIMGQRIRPQEKHR